jgi:hypothetical protein
MGRPTKYDDTFPEKAFEWASKGLTNASISANLGISYQSFCEYQNKYVEFFDAIKRGRAIVDEIVENSLYKNAIGYEFEEVCTIVKIDPSGNPLPSEIKKTKKHIRGDVTAQIFWLKNRTKEWRDKIDITTDGEPIKQVIQINGQDLSF